MFILLSYCGVIDILSVVAILTMSPALAAPVEGIVLFAICCRRSPVSPAMRTAQRKGRVGSGRVGSGRVGSGRVRAGQVRLLRPF